MWKLRCQYVFLLLPILINGKTDTGSTTEHTTHSCPFTRIIEDIFRIQKKYSESPPTSKDDERAKLIINRISNITTYKNTSVSIQEELINDIIASINRIKNNISSHLNTDENRLNEAIILKYPASEKNAIKNKNKPNVTNSNKNINTQIKSGIEEKFDVQTENVASIDTDKGKFSHTKEATDIQSTRNKTDYVEILTVEPNTTTNNNTSQHNIIEVLKHLMPMLNSSSNKELHSVTIIERNHSKNHSVSETKNVSTLVVKYCDKGNLTAESLTKDINSQPSSVNTTESGDTIDDYPDANKELPIVDQGAIVDDYSDKDEPEDDDKHGEIEANSTINKNRDVLEAAEYGMRKMHELYSVLEPKLYSMGLWLDDTNPARYVAAFNAPSEDVSKYSRYGYATIQAATKLKELNRAVVLPGERGISAAKAI